MAGEPRTRRPRSRSRSRARGTSRKGVQAGKRVQAPASEPSLQRPLHAPSAAEGVLELSHLVYEVANLASACDVFAELTGVRPVPGGRHEALGLQNAIVGLGGGRYLEFLARTSSRRDPGRPHTGGVPVTVLGADCDRPRLVTWCCDASRVGLSSLVAGLAALPQKHLFPAEIALMTSLTQEGRRITWRDAADKHRECLQDSLPMEGLLPFLRDFPGEPNFRPGLAAPAGCELIELKAEHPDPQALGAALRSLRAGHLISVSGTERGKEPRLLAVIRHAYGQLQLE